MRTLLVSYDLLKPGQDYTSLTNAIKSAGSDWAKPLLSVWLVRTDKDPAKVRDELAQYIDQGDKLLVIECADSAAWWNLSDGVSDWIKRELA